MRITSDDRKSLGTAVGVFFSSLKNSIKLIWSNIEFNLKVIGNSFRNDQAAIEKNFADYGQRRLQLHDELRKQFRKLGKHDPAKLSGPGLLFAAAMNPALVISTKFGGGSESIRTGAAGAAYKKRKADLKASGLRDPDDDAEDDDTDYSVKSTTSSASRSERVTSGAAAAAVGKMSDRLRQASDVFGFGRQISEQVQPAQPTQVVPQEADAAALASLREKAMEDFNILKQKIASVEKSLVLYVRVAKTIAESKDIAALRAAVSSAATMGMKMSDEGLDEAESQAREEIQKIEREKPGSTKEAADAIIKKFPELGGLPPDQVVTQALAFGSVKGELLSQMQKLISAMIARSRDMVGLPLDQNTIEALKTSPEGNQYLEVLNGFERKLTGTSVETSKIRG
jgi:hypothetical protein